MPSHPVACIKPVAVVFIFLLCPALLLLQEATAQSAIHGTVTDKTNQPIANANVLLLRNTDSTLVKGAVTNEKGVYAFDRLTPGSYLLSFSFTGFDPLYKSLITAPGKEKTDLGTQQLQAAQRQLAEVTVKARKPLFEQKTDRLVINVENSITSAGSTALDVLERSPGVIVDRQNNSISLSGKNGVVIMINGKINHMPIDAVIQLLGGMNSGNIDKIELITTPPANFDAEGNAGFINIVLKENTQAGTNGSYTLSMGYGNRDMPAANANFNHRKGKLNLYGNYSFSRVHAEQDWNFYHLVNNSGTVTETSTDTYRNTAQRNHSASLGADYTVSKKTIIGALVSGYDNKWSMNANNTSTIYKNKQADTVLHIANNEINHWQNYAVNINLQHNFSENEKLTINTDYIYYHDNNPVDYLYAYYDHNQDFLFNSSEKSTKSTPIRFWVTAADYSKKLGGKLILETGAKSTLSTFNNDVQIERLQQNQWIKDPGFSAKYTLKENITAAYASLSASVNDKTDIKAGLRYEYTNSNLGSDSLENIVDRHYGKLFPSFFIHRKINDNNAINFSYSRRITRPTFNDMAPFVIFIDPNTFFSGNPALQPSLTDALKVDYTLKKLLLSFAYSYEKGPIANFNPTIDSTNNIETLSAVNLENTRTFSLTLALPVQVCSWWSMSYSAIAVWQQTNAIYNKSPLQLNQEDVHINATQSFKLPKNLSIEISGFYQSATIFGIYKTDAFGSLDIGFQKKLANNKSAFRLNFGDVLNTLKFNFGINRPDQNLVLLDRLAFVFPSVKLSYTRSFGNAKLKEKRDRSTGSEDEQGRVQ